ncbi:MAG: hypothetical protein C4523_00020 [Myxococcales bacterium]|nr:MAG: hypothetical protein C4523_00020 [Myxococcales bacterium]
MCRGIAPVLALALAACGSGPLGNLSGGSDDEPPLPNYKAMILANKGSLWKDPDSIKGASITRPKRHLGWMWHVCIKANAKNSFGGYTGEKEMLIGIHDDGRVMGLMEDARLNCEYELHAAFPELNGDYKAPQAKR